jgi:hypothetical protein
MEAQVGAVPGFYASQSAQNEAKGAAFNYASVLLDPDRWLPIKGVVVGTRIFGDSGDRPIEPYLGYRRRLIDRVSLGVIGFGSTKRVEKYAAYHGVRLGGEAMVDVEVYAASEKFRVRAQGAIAATRIFVSGKYCVDDQGVGIDCDEDMTRNTIVSGKFVGVYPAATAQIALDFGRHQGTFDSLRIALLGGGGQMPLVLSGDENGTDLYFHLGISLTVALGLGRPADE